MKSIGLSLKNARQKKNQTIEDVYKIIKVHPKYLRALENDEYSIFKGSVHSKGFLKIYAEYLGLDIDEILALWRREYEPAFAEEKFKKYDKIHTLEPEKFVITPSILLVIFTGVFLLIFFLYLFFQYKGYTGQPNLDIYYPDDNQVLQVDVLDITGKSDLDCDIFINNQKIIPNQDGGFIASVKLREGINTISIKSVNKLGKETEKIRSIIYRPEKNILPIPTPIEKNNTSDSEEEIRTD